MLVSWDKCAVAMSWHKSCLLKGFRRWRGALWLHKETLTFKSPAAWLTNTVYGIEMNKISPNFDILHPLYGLFGKFKELTAWPLYGSFGCKELIVGIRNMCTVIVHTGLFFCLSFLNASTGAQLWEMYITGRWVCCWSCRLQYGQESFCAVSFHTVLL